MKTFRNFVLSMLALLASGCDPAPPEGETEGVDLPLGACGHGLYVLASDYQSTTLSIVDWDGHVHRRGILSSASTDVGLSAALSGDVVAPTDELASDELLLIDRYPAGVVTAFSPSKSEVTQQLTVRTGFAANPQDALVARPGVLYVSRYEENAQAGSSPHDRGSDVLVLDRAEGAPIGSIDLRPFMAPPLLPRPSRMLSVSGAVAVLLSAYSRDFTEAGEGRVVLIDPTSDTPFASFGTQGLVGCSGLARSPGGSRLAVGCSGSFGGSSAPTLEDAGIAVFAVDGPGSLRHQRTIAASSLGGPPSFSLGFLDETTLIAVTFGELDANGSTKRDDVAFAIDAGTGAATEILRSGGQPFSLGDIRCASRCARCVLTDAGRGALQFIDPIDDSRVTVTAAPFGDGVGLPPRYLGAY